MGKEVPSLHEAKEYIYSLDFSNIINKMVEHNGWLKKETELLSHIYRNFLFLNKKYIQEFGCLPPSEEIDEFWHNHILDTKQYRNDCQMIFGNYLDHYPYFGIDKTTSLIDLNKAFNKTKELYLLEFGIELPKVTTRFSNVIFFLRRTIFRLLKRMI